MFLAKSALPGVWISVMCKCLTIPGLTPSCAVRPNILSYVVFLAAKLL
jgi:hypothetical protein